MAADDEAAECSLSACCISHEFYKAASKFPHKIAVIHAAGFARRSQDSTKISNTEPPLSSRPPVYDGDECFTFSDMLSAVENLSWRLKRVLDGGNDPYLINPRSVNIFSKKSLLQKSNPSVQQQPTKIKSIRTPKVVGIYMEPSVEYIVAVLSVLRCGEAFLPLDPTLPKSRILSLVSYSKADIIIGIDMSIEGNRCHRLDSSRWLVDEGSCPVLSVSLRENIEELSHPFILGWPCESESLRSFCYLMYTSGSTGKPKGVCGTEIGVLH